MSHHSGHPPIVVRINMVLPEAAFTNIETIIEARVQQSPLIHYNVWDDSLDMHECAYDVHLIIALDDLWEAVKHYREPQIPWCPSDSIFDDSTIKYFRACLRHLFTAYPDAIIQRLINFRERRLEIDVRLDGEPPTCFTERLRQQYMTPFQKEVRHVRTLYG